MTKDDKSGCLPQPNRPKRFRKIGDKIALETSDTPSLKDISDLVKEIESKTDPGKLAEEKIKQRARERRRKDAIRKTLRDKLKPQKFEARSYSPDADAFDTKYLDGSNRSFWGFPITNGIIQYGDIVRGFHAPSEVYGLIDAMPKGRDFILPKPIPTVPVKKGEKVYPCTVAFLYSKIKPTQEILTNNGATDITSWDYTDTLVYNGATAVGFRQRFDDFGDYETAVDALSNNIKESRKTRPKAPGTGDTGAADNAAWGSGSADAITVWYYIGDPANVIVNPKIFVTTGVPTATGGDYTTLGPGVCMEVRRQSGISLSIFPREVMGSGPLTKKLKQSFPELGGKIGYAGDIRIWHGIDDYIPFGGFGYLRGHPGYQADFQTPSSYPPTYSQNPAPWYQTGITWFQFGWNHASLSINCTSSSWVNVNTSLIDGLGCGESIGDYQWNWGGYPSTPGSGFMDGNGASGFGTLVRNSMYVCWQGHRDHAGMAREFFEAFRTYWGLPGQVTYLGAANPYGCGGAAPDGGGGGYPPAPLGPSRFLIEALGRKAEVWLKVCRQEDPPIEIKLPFEFVAVIEKLRILGGGKFGSIGNPAAQVTEKFVLETAAIRSSGSQPRTNCELIHATLNVDAEYAYIDILFGVEREFETPLSIAIPSLLLNLGAGNPGSSQARFPGWKVGLSVGEWINTGTTETLPRIIKDSFSYCQSYKVKLPTKDDKTLTIEASQRYKRPEPITLTAAAPDNEFNRKYLICDFRTERRENIPPPAGYSSPVAPWQNPQPYFASFGGLPALSQGLGNFGANVGTNRFMVYDAQPYYKAQSDWTQLDYIHFELMERPERFWKADTTFPTNVICAKNGDIKFNLDGKFQRHGRSEQMLSPTPFGYPSGGSQEQYGLNGSYIYAPFNFPLAISFKEQLIGNGVIENGVITRWNRVTTSSFPVFGQRQRNP